MEKVSQSLCRGVVVLDLCCSMKGCRAVGGLEEDVFADCGEQLDDGEESRKAGSG